MQKKITYIISTLLIISIVIQILLFGGFKKETLESININFLAGIIGVFITYKIIDKLLEKHEIERKSLFISEAIKNEYIILLGTISQYYISYVTKKPPVTSKDLDYDKTIDSVLNNLDEYIDENFLRNGVTTIQPKMINGWIESVEKVYGYQEFCEITKQTIRKSIDEFFIKYNSLIPEEVIVSLLTINNYFMNPIFTTGLEQGIRIDLSNAQFSTKSFKEPIKEIGLHILELYKIIEL